MADYFFPFPPAPGSNGIGLFQIGVSPIGTIPPFQWQSTVISQYANSPILLQLLDNMNQYLDQTQNFENFFDLIWNVNTAVGYGLDVWGRIVGVSRTLLVSTGSFFGFDQGLPDSLPWNQGIFFAGETLTSNFALSDEAYRTLIFTKALFNICDGSIPAINQLLMNLFGMSGQCYVADNGLMGITYTFEFALSPVQRSIVLNSGVLPTPCGVAATISSL